MNRIFGWALALSAVAALGYFILAATAPDVANDIANWLADFFGGDR